MFLEKNTDGRIHYYFHRDACDACACFIKQNKQPKVKFNAIVYLCESFSSRDPLSSLFSHRFVCASETRVGEKKSVRFRDKKI